MLHHEVFKANETENWLVLLHGFGGNSRIWYKQKKELIRKFNVIFVDLHGHGKSKVKISDFKNYELEDIAKDILKILDYLNIKKAAFMGVSLGSVIARAIGLIAPERVRFFVLVGAVLRFNTFSKVLLTTGRILKNVMPYMWLYKLFAWIMMPKKNHESARSIFVREAAKLGRTEFLFWFRLTNKVNALHSRIRKGNFSIPTQYIMGKEDHIFINEVKKEAPKEKESLVNIIQNSGHLCNLERPLEFNSVAVSYIENQFLKK